MAADTQKSRAAFWAKLAVLGPFWGVAAFAAVAIIGSVITSLYGRPPVFTNNDLAARAHQRAWCLRTLAGLQDELESEVTRVFARPAKTPMENHFSTFDERWRAGFENAASHCGTELQPSIADAYTKLRVLHEGYTEAVTQLIRTRSGISQELASQIKRLAEDLPPTPDGPRSRPAR